MSNDEVLKKLRDDERKIRYSFIEHGYSDPGPLPDHIVDAIAASVAKKQAGADSLLMAAVTGVELATVISRQRRAELTQACQHGRALRRIVSCRRRHDHE
jgi:hypothetical protein